VPMGLASKRIVLPAFRPMIRTIIIAITLIASAASGVPWLSFSCPACGQADSVDLRTIDRHPRASISA